MMSRYDSPSYRWWKNTQGRTYKFHISSHLSDLAHLHHDELVHLRITLFIVPHFGVGSEIEGGVDLDEKRQKKMEGLDAHSDKDKIGANLTRSFINSKQTLIEPTNYNFLNALHSKYLTDPDL